MTEEDTDAELFDDDAIDATAADHDVDSRELTDLVNRHQDAVAALPGADDLVYEWRKHYDDPIVERTADAYYLRAPEWVWGEFADYLDLDETAREALVELHRRTVAARPAADPSPPDGRTYVALER